MKVRVYFLKRPPDNFPELEQVDVFANWIFENLYNLVWEAEFKNLVTPDIVATRFRVEANPFGFPFIGKPSHADLSVGDIIQLGRAYYLVLPHEFRELEPQST